MRFIGISGKKGSGKSTLANGLRDYFVKHHHTVLIHGFADILKEKAVSVFGLDPDHVYGDKTFLSPYWRDGKQLSYRECLQQMREWLDWTREVVITEFKLYCEIEGADIVICDDIRFPEECELFSVIIRLTRKPNADTHESETALDPWNHPWTKFSVIHDTTPEITLRKAIEYCNTRKPN